MAADPTEPFPIAAAPAPSAAAPNLHSRQASTLTAAPTDLPPTTTSFTRPGRRLSPGLALRLQRLSKQQRRNEEVQRQYNIGRIPEEQLKELERLQREVIAKRAHDGINNPADLTSLIDGKNKTVDVHRLGVVWTGRAATTATTPTTHTTSRTFATSREMPSGGVRLDGGPVLTDNEAASILESDVSSIIDISDHFVASDTEDDTRDDDPLQDTRKYKLPDPGKTRLKLHSKEPMSPGPRYQPPPYSSQSDYASPSRRPASASIPSTPISSHVTTPGQPPSGRSDFFGSHWANGSAENVNDSASGISRAGSIYTLGRASFTGQLAQLTAMRLPDANSLSKRISSIPTSAEAVKALSDASDQIRRWISKASDVLAGLTAEDDVEWAAAGGREGIADVDTAITRFEGLVQVYIVSIERIQTREDAAQLSAAELADVVAQMEAIVVSWQKIKDTVRGIKEQVELAMEWEKLWNSVLGEIGQEMEGLNQLVFEMEERRHQNAGGILSSKDTIDLNELEIIVEEHPGGRSTMTDSKMDLQATSPASAVALNLPEIDKDDASLLGLFARMQPLRASLDFLPMRLSVFHIRGNATFPSACLDLKNRREQLEEQWQRLQNDAESLRRELGEDRWIVVFRNAGRQALKMCESIQRSYAKLKEILDASEPHVHVPNLGKKIESYEAKKIHYGPAIERVLTIIDRGVSDRLTLNGEILRLQSDMKERWSTLQAEMAALDAMVATIVSIDARDQELRDSVSTVVSSERSLASSYADTPGSSSASSVVGTSRKNSSPGMRTPTSLTTFKVRSGSKSNHSSIPLRTPLARTVVSGAYLSPNGSPASASTPSKNSPAGLGRSEASSTAERPRWANARRADVRDFRPLSAYEPSPYAKPSVAPKHNFLRASSNPTGPAHATSTTYAPSSRVVSTPLGPTHTKPSTTSTRKSAAPSSHLTAPSAALRRQSMQNLRGSANPSTAGPRSVSSMHKDRRASLLARATQASPPPPLPQPTDGNEADSESPAHHHHHSRRPPSAQSGGSSSARPRSGMDEGGVRKGEKPRWRP